MKTLVCVFLAAAAFAAKPAQPVMLKSSQLEVTFDPLKGLPVEYRLLSNKATLRGGAGSEVTATIFRSSPRRYTNFAVRPEVIRSNKNRADFQFTVREKGASMASFLLRYELSGAELLVTLEAVLEEQGFELIDVGLPELASVREEDGGAWLAHGDGGGTMALLSKATPGHLHGVAATLPVVMVGSNRMLCVQEVLSYMDATELSVDHRAAALGTVKIWRVNGASGNDSTPNLLVGGTPLCRLNFLADLDRNGAVDWLDGAKMLRARTPEIPTHFYDDKLLYRIDGATSAESMKIMQRVKWLTAGAPQIVYLSGWQDRGEVSKKLGGLDGLLKLQRDARAMNATVSLSDTFDESYQDTTAWDANMIARKPDGELWKSGNAYLVGLAKYMEGPGPERVRSTVERYQIRDTYLVDGLSSDVLRNDWDRTRPASGLKNLVDGRYKVLEEFKKRGIDIVSQELRYAMLGKIGVSYEGPSGEESPFGGEPIPLAAAIYRKAAIWGMRGQAWKKHPELSSFLYNGHPFPRFPGDEDAERQFTRFYYGILLPWYQVHYRNIEAFLHDGDRSVISLEGNSRIDLDWRSDQYTVTVSGVDVARDGDTFCPVGKDRVAFYSPVAKELSAPLPEGWDANAVVALALSADGAKPVRASVREGKLMVSVQAEHPVMVFRDAAAVPKL